MTAIKDILSSGMKSRQEKGGSTEKDRGRKRVRTKSVIVREGTSNYERNRKQGRERGGEKLRDTAEKGVKKELETRDKREKV